MPESAYIEGESVAEASEQTFHLLSFDFGFSLTSIREAMGWPLSDPVLIFALAMLTLLIAPLLMSKLKMPGLIGLILAGAVIGPNGLGVLDRDATIVLLGTVGLLYLMFVAGLSLDLDQFISYRMRSITFGLLSFCIPQGLAVWLSMQLLGFSPARALLLGSIVGSHTLLAYPITRRLGIANNRGITITTGGTFITDLLSLIILAVVIAGTKENLDPSFVDLFSDKHLWINFGGHLALYMIGVVLIIPRLGRWYFRHIQDAPTIDFVFLLSVLFASAYLATLAGLAPIIGAFIAGVLLNRLVPNNSVLMNRVNFVGDALFIPFFLLSVGMLVDFRVLAEKINIWLYAGMFTALVVVGKGLAAKLTQWLFRFKASEGWTMAGLSIPQAAATLAVTLIGFEVGLFTADVVNAVVIMILLTCMIGPWLVERYGRIIAAESATEPVVSAATAAQRILVPLANPETMEPLLDVAFMIRDPKSSEPVYPLTIARDGSDVEQEVAQGDKNLSHAVVHAAAADVPVQPVTRVDLNISAGIIRATKELRISQIVIGWAGNHPATRQWIFGSVLDHLLQNCPQMIMVCRFRHPLNTSKRIVMAVPPLADREPGFELVQQAVRQLAGQLGAKLVVLTPESHTDRIKQRMSNGSRLKPTVESLPAWSRLLGHLSQQIDVKDDLLILLSAREGRLSYHPSLAAIPGRIIQTHPEASLITIYPSEIDRQNHASMMNLTQMTKPTVVLPTRSNYSLKDANHTPLYLAKECFQLQLGPISSEEAIERLVKPVFPNAPDLTRQIVRALLQASREYSTEIRPGVILVHAHVNQVQKPMLLVGTSKPGIPFPKVRQPANIMLVLISPKKQGDDRHLQSLARIAHLVHEKDLMETLYKIRDPQEALSLLKSAPLDP